jgi:hypothetical protein
VGLKLSLQAGTHVTRPTATLYAANLFLVLLCPLGRGGKSIKQIIFAQTISFWKKYRNPEMFWDLHFYKNVLTFFMFDS